MKGSSWPPTWPSRSRGASPTSAPGTAIFPATAPATPRRPRMASVLAEALVIARKDLLLEFRSRTAFLSSLAFTALVLAIFNFARDPTAVSALDLAPGILWITFSFAGLLGLNRAFGLELQNRTLEGLLLSPVSRTAI